jgi:hypothetical protein
MEASISFKYIIKNLLIQFSEKLIFSGNFKQTNRPEWKNSRKNTTSIVMTLLFLPIKNTRIYKQNYKNLYDKKTDQCFSLCSSPYRHFIYIENEEFITIDPDLRKANDDYIQEHFKSNKSE